MNDPLHILTDYKERMRRILLKEPLSELARKQKKDTNGIAIDMRMIGLFVLLYFFEMKLMRETKVGIREAASYIEQLLKETYILSTDEVIDLLEEVKEVFRPAKGEYKTYSFYNIESKKTETITFSYFKTSYFDVKNSRQYYELDDDGLELIFATKEYFQEFQLSIHQLMLRKLLEKGELQGALRQINEMRMDVEQLHDRIEKLSLEVRRNIINLEIQQKYMQLFEDRNYRIAHENEEFEQLHAFIISMRKMNESKMTTEDQEAYRLLVKIEDSLMAVHAKHKELLTRSLHLREEVLEAAEQSLYTIGLDHFNIDQEIVSEFVTQILPIEKMKGVLAPFLSMERYETWSLFTIFAPQQWRKEYEIDRKHYISQVVEQEEKEKYAEHVRQQFQIYMERLLAFGQSREQWTLEHWIDAMNKDEKSFLQKESFYYFLTLCHQKSPLQGTEKEIVEEHSLHFFAKALPQLPKALHIIEAQPILRVTERYTMQNLQFSWKGVEGYV